MVMKQQVTENKTIKGLETAKNLIAVSIFSEPVVCKQ